ncbi:hypothetical protein ACIBBE_24285 [Streptomyces sp. NPDC051644]|uniref:hypothetical protein n=1 Tax=Streptomyces sp. NPDC051644 TaxID=3365666 RepID=UPI0037B1AC9B
MSHSGPAADAHRPDPLLEEECSYCHAPANSYCDPDCPVGVIDPSYTRDEEPPPMWERPPPPGW